MTRSAEALKMGPGEPDNINELILKLCDVLEGYSRRAAIAALEHVRWNIIGGDEDDEREAESVTWPRA
jgi:hypothetical protein